MPSNDNDNPAYDEVRKHCKVHTWTKCNVYVEP